MISFLFQSLHFIYLYLLFFFSIIHQIRDLNALLIIWFFSKLNLFYFLLIQLRFFLSLIFLHLFFILLHSCFHNSHSLLQSCFNSLAFITNSFLIIVSFSNCHFSEGFGVFSNSNEGIIFEFFFDLLFFLIQSFFLFLLAVKE